jgi:hypothetical protein
MFLDTPAMKAYEWKVEVFLLALRWCVQSGHKEEVSGPLLSVAASPAGKIHSDQWMRSKNRFWCSG